MQLVLQGSSPADQFIAVPEQLWHIAPLRGRNPDPRKLVSEQQVQNMTSIPRVRLLLAHHRRTDLRCISYPQRVSLLGEHPFEPLRISGGLHSYARRSGKPGVKLPSLTVFVF